MWRKEITLETEVTKERIWALWSDVEQWKTWDSQVAHAKLNGAFEVGSKGVLKPTKGPTSKFTIQSATHLKEFTTRTSLPLAKMDFVHTMTEIDGKLMLMHGVEIRGVTSFLFARIIGKKIIAELPKAMRNLVQMAKK